MIDHDDYMRQHADALGRVLVDGEGVTVRGQLIAWRPERTRTGSNGLPITRSVYLAVVQPDGKRGTRNYPLTRYDVKPETR